MVRVLLCVSWKEKLSAHTGRACALFGDVFLSLPPGSGDGLVPPEALLRGIVVRPALFRLRKHPLTDFCGALHSCVTEQSLECRIISWDNN